MLRPPGGRLLLSRRAREWNPRRNVREGSYPGVPSFGHPENRCQGRRQAPRSGPRSLTAGSSLHPLQAGTSHREVFFYAQTSRWEVAASQAGKGMEPETQRRTRLGPPDICRRFLMTRIIVFSELGLVNGPNPYFDNLIIILISCFGKIKISCGKRANANFCCNSDIVASPHGGIIDIRSVGYYPGIRDN